jgi:hypothetical protein
MASGVGAGTAPEVAFLRHDGIYRSDAFPTSNKPGPDCRFPVGSGQVLKRAGRKHAYSSSRRVPAGYSSIGLVATRARLRFTGNRNLTCTFHRPRQKGTFLLCQQGDISTLP